LSASVTTTLRKILENSDNLKETVFGKRVPRVSFKERSRKSRMFSIEAGSVSAPYKAKSPKLKCRLDGSPEIVAILDAGAEISCISDTVVQKLGLLSIPIRKEYSA